MFTMEMYHGVWVPTHKIAPEGPDNVLAVFATTGELELVPGNRVRRFPEAYPYWTTPPPRPTDFIEATPQ